MPVNVLKLALISQKMALCTLTAKILWKKSNGILVCRVHEVVTVVVIYGLFASTAFLTDPWVSSNLLAVS
jgi:hypothetical protein